MTKNLFALLFTCFAAFSLRADLIWYEPFAYPDGSITTNSGGLWIRHSGTAGDSIVKNQKLEVSGNSNTNAGRTDDIHRDFCTSSCTYTSSPTVVYASFTINCTNLPTAAASNYIAHFYTSSTTFHGRMFSLIGSIPGTWRLGVSTTNNAINKIFPVDLAPNTDYQVVLQWDPVSLFAATLWVNPISQSDVSVTSNDTLPNPATANAFAFRQAAGTTSFFCTVSNLAVATSWEEAATNVWATNAVSPVVAQQPKSATNFVGDTVKLVTVANGQGLVNLNYQWRKGGVNISNSGFNTNVLTISGAASSDSGSYDVVVTTPYGLSATSAPAFLWVTNPPVPPTITAQPTNTTVYYGQTATFRVVASGATPITYQWFYNGAPAGPNVAGADTATLTVSNVRTNNGTEGTYRVDVTNPFGTTASSNVTLTAVAAPVVTIGYLRGLVDPIFFLPTNTTVLYTATGIVTSHTNLTTAANSSFFIQDDTGGIDVFYGGNTAARPEAGDSVTVTGPLGHFSSLLELNLVGTNPGHSVVTNSHNNPLPAGVVLPLSFTNGIGYGGVSNVIHHFQGAVVTLTNVFFPSGFAGTAVFASGQNYTITNSNGDTFAFRVDARVGDIIGKPIPAFAWTVTGPMSFFLSGTAPDRSAGFQIVPTLYSDIVTNAPSAVTSSSAIVNGKPVITWVAQPYMSYSVLRASDVAGPYVPVATGLTFNSANGVYTDTSAPAAGGFYQVASP